MKAHVTLKVLLVDNTRKEPGTRNKRIVRLEEMLRSFPADVKTIRFEDIPSDVLEKGHFSAMVLSGSGMNISDPVDRVLFRKEIEIVRRSKVPVLGICFGFHIALHSFGCTVLRNQGSSEFDLPNGKVITIHVKGDEGGIVGDGDHPVNVSHRDFVPPTDPVLSRDFYICSVSRDGQFEYVQFAKHRTRPIYALQFHPEAYDGAPDEVIQTGKRIVHGFLRTC